MNLPKLHWKLMPADIDTRWRVIYLLWFCVMGLETIGAIISVTITHSMIGAAVNACLAGFAAGVVANIPIIRRYAALLRSMDVTCRGLMTLVDEQESLIKSMSSHPSVMDDPPSPPSLTRH